MHTRTIIAETAHVSAIQQELGGDTVVVTFNEMGFVRNGERFWGDDFLLKLGVSAVGIVTPRPNWYPPRDMNEVIPAVMAAVAGRRVVTYGHSQGGFGALKFSARLRAAVALCFCPQWSIDPADVGSFDDRTTPYFDAALGNGVRLLPADVCQRSFIFYDRQDLADARHADVLSAYEGVHTVLVPFAMHDTIRIVTEGRGASSLINLCRGPTLPTAEDFRQLIRKSRAHSKTYFNYMIRNLILRMSCSRAHSSKFLHGAFAKTGNDSHFYAALVAHARGDEQIALAQLEQASHKDFQGIDLLFLWSLTDKLEYLPAQLAVAAEIREREPSNTWACLHAVKTLTRAGRLRDARAELTRISAHPDASTHARYFTEFSQAIQRSAVGQVTDV